MKKAFTMIELVFVIVILGVLAGVAVPKLMGTRNDAKIAVLKSTIQEIRKGIEAYAGNQIIVKGVKEYPNTLCDDKNLDSANKCNFKSGMLFGNVLNTTIPSGKGKDWNGFTSGVEGEVFLYYPDSKNNKKAYAFQYIDGEFNCLDKMHKFSGVIKCSTIGEIAKPEVR